MLHIRLSSKARVLGLLVAGLVCLPAVAHAETDTMTRVERTPAYVVILSIGPAQTMDMHSMQPGDASMAHDTGMLSDQMDQGMAVNHRLDVRINQADSDAVVSDVTPNIRIIDKSTGESRELPQVVGTSGGMHPNDFHYGQNVFLPDGAYQVTVQLGQKDTAVFRDVTVVATSMMAEPSMAPGGMSHDMGMQDQAPPQP